MTGFTQQLLDHMLRLRVVTLAEMLVANATL
jgi:hypothetical protein